MAFDIDHGVDRGAGERVLHPHFRRVAGLRLQRDVHGRQVGVQVQAVQRQRLLAGGDHAGDALQAVLHAGFGEIAGAGDAGLARGSAEQGDRLGGGPALAQRRLFGPGGQGDDDLGVVLALGVAEAAVLLDEAGGEQAEHLGGLADVAVGIGELAAEAVLQRLLGVLGGQRGQGGGVAVGQRQFVQRPAGAAFAPGGVELDVQVGRYGVAGEGSEVAGDQMCGQLAHRGGRRVAAGQARLDLRRIGAAIAGGGEQRGGGEQQTGEAAWAHAGMFLDSPTCILAAAGGSGQPRRLPVPFASKPAGGTVAFFPRLRGKSGDMVDARGREFGSSAAWRGGCGQKNGKPVGLPYQSGSAGGLVLWLGKVSVA